MNRFSRSAPGLSILLLLIAPLGCSLGGANPDAIAPLDGDIAAVYEQIDETIGTAEASSRSMCRVLPLGAKPCGGPWFYRVYSIERTDVDVLNRLAERYTELDRERMRGRISTCELQSPPTIRFQGGQCTTDSVAPDGPYPSID